MEDVYIHESSYVDNDCEIGPGTKIWHFCHVMSGAIIGNGCVIGQNVNITGVSSKYGAASCI
jgi:UDP-2-acetamido-3-amino-2,3-dideoxy-glucuronate N-acetyltransferase